jgi:hypothetical protein
MPCDDWRILLERRRQAVHFYHEAADALDTTATAWQRAEMARRRVENSRAAILHHEHEHGCLHGEIPVVAEATPGAEGCRFVFGAPGSTAETR